jgi:hypothetical protein
MHGELLVSCDQCHPDPERPVYRCAGCYLLFAHAISARTQSLVNKEFAYQDTPVFKALLNSPWKRLKDATSIDDATLLIVPFDSVLEVLPVEDSRRGFFLRWKTSCPCCFDDKITEPEVAVPVEEFANLCPMVTRQTVVLRNCPVFDDCTGEEVKKTTMVHVVTVKPVVTTATASKFKFRSSDGDEHRGYEIIAPLTPNATRADGIDQVWQLVRSRDMDFESSALSFNRIGCLDSLFDAQSNPQRGLDAACRIGTLLRRAAPYREASSGKAPATIARAIEKRGLRASCLRVNRVRDPNGHGGGFTLEEIKAMICSPYISGCIPRSPIDSVIAWPVASRGIGGSITEIIPFYVSVQMKMGLAVMHPPHCAIPRHGFVSKGTRVVSEFQDDRYLRPLRFGGPVDFLRIYTASVYSGARILCQLGQLYPLLKTSVTAAKRTLLSEKNRRDVYSAGSLTPSSSTRSRRAGERDSYLPGQAVFVVDGNATWSAHIVGPAGIDSGEKQFCVKFVGDLEKSTPYMTIPISRLLPDAFGDVRHRGDDDDVVRPTFYSNDQLVAERGHHSKTFLGFCCSRPLRWQSQMTEQSSALDSERQMNDRNLTEKAKKMKETFREGEKK